MPKCAQQLVAVDDPDFTRFWSCYPRRCAKKEARKAWAQLQPTPELVDQMIEALTWQCRQRQWRRREFIPLPATWLRGERWTDDPPEGEGTDIHGHVPPCRSWAACTAKVLADAKKQPA